MCRPGDQQISLPSLLGLLLFSLLMPAGVAAESPRRAAFRFREIDDKSLGLWEGEHPVLVYRFGEMNLPNVRAAGVRSSYVHPIYGLDGEVLTDDFPADHYHHHGLFWGWPHVTIGEREYDLWKLRGIRIGFQRWMAKEATPSGARLAIENGWFVGDKQVMKEEATFDAHPTTDSGRFIDVTLKWTPTEDTITLGGAEGKSYGGLSLRFAPRTATTITVPHGPASDDLLSTQLPWADLSARFRNASAPSGIAVFVSPRHPDFPPEWMTRGYGLLAVGWPGIHRKTLQPGKSTTCRYRLWIHRDKPDAAQIQELYDAYSASER